MLLDLVFCEYNYEIFCTRCGARKMVDRESVFGRWLAKATPSL